MVSLVEANRDGSGHRLRLARLIGERKDRAAGCGAQRVSAWQQRSLCRAADVEAGAPSRASGSPQPLKLSEIRLDALDVGRLLSGQVALALGISWKAVNNRGTHSWADRTRDLGRRPTRRGVTSPPGATGGFGPRRRNINPHMGAVETRRTVVKSVPELWAELSEVALLARMLGQFGEIRITRAVPEETIEWESELARGLVELEPSGFGTRVRLTAELATPTITPPAEVPGVPKMGLLARLLRRGPPAVAPAPMSAQTPPPAPLDPGLAQGALTAVLDEIGAARHRPFSRELGVAPPTT
jgi:hypothetical protein